MNANQFLAWAAQPGANVLSNANYAALAALLAGFQTGIVPSAQLNSVLRQATFIAAAMAQFTADNGPGSVLDNGEIAVFEAQFEAALLGYLAGHPPAIDGTLNVLARAVNINSLGDTPLPIVLPAGITRYRISELELVNDGVLGSLTTAKVGLYTAISQGGVTLAAQQALSSITSNAAATSGNAMQLTLTLPVAAWLTATTLYLNVGTAQGVAASVDAILRIQPLS